MSWRVAMIAPLAGLGLLASGCGGPKVPSVASIGTGSTSATSTSAASGQIAWAACIRSHGVPNFPDPNSQGEINLAGINIRSAQFLAAHQACQSLVPPNHGRTPAQQKQMVAHQLAVAECMRKHGVPNFPDPDSQGAFVGPTSQTESSPIAQKAEQICNPGTG